MKSRTPRILIAVPLGVALLGAGLAGPALGQPLEERVAALERLLRSDSLMQLLSSIEQLRGEMRELRGELEVQKHAMEQLRARQREQYLDLDGRLKGIEAGGVAAAGPAEPATAPPSAEVPAVASLTPPAAGGADPLAEQQAYQDAFDRLRSGRFDEAAEGFQGYLERYPDGNFADDAQYWLGETYYVARSFEPAKREFERLLARFPQSQKRSHAMLKLGYIHDELGDREQARAVLTELTQRHPDSTAAGLALQRLQRLQGQ